ncbi:RsmF rRNA methyltransferase first C-terminal domain-containing protein [Scopulibacillus daqui]|uniref:RsmF rRNA methyltransferase first C-terminal domain-containing protein n=1 Tax=Scopulibacillus daqui TaxID=1469162 RepID=UPI00195FA6C9|nr:RsmF rRNA methyltransferase first C-terminal domain-containing protein [Scopulibacillus daqui]
MNTKGAIKVQLPADFIHRMKTMLQDDSERFFSSYKDNKASGLRVNTLKIDVEAFKNLAPFPIDSIPFCRTGFYYHPADEPGKHPYHHAGLYYIQEPSAMFVAEVLDAKPGERILDLCAAPGGKSTQIAGAMKNQGILVANDIHPKRVKALSENIERMGASHAIVTNETPEKLANHFQGYFDKIVVDAPCSGEGMFRKDPEAVKYWSLDHVEHCASLQKDILESAYKMLKEGGILVYSTCTFSPSENEQMIEKLIDKHPDMQLMPIDKGHGINSGQPDWTESKLQSLHLTARLWPHHLKGEGHFVAKLQKNGRPTKHSIRLAKGISKKININDYRTFEKQALNISIQQPLFSKNSQLYALPDHCPDFTGLKVIRPGLHLGELKKNRFEPNHALAHGLPIDSYRHKVDLSLNDDSWKKYLRGETLQTGGDRGWCAVTIEGFPLGWGKEVKGTLKNFYPKGLRVNVK